MNLKDFLFGNIGGKLKNIAVITCFIGMIASLLCGLTIGNFFGFIIFGILGCLLSWLSTLALYGLGQLIENTEEMNLNCSLLLGAFGQLNENVDEIKKNTIK